MEKQNSFLPNSLTIIYLISIVSAAATTTPTELLPGFEATPATGTTKQFQPILTDPTGNFSLAFLRLHDDTKLSLAVIHLPSAVPLWHPAPSSWTSSDHTRLTFNGSLVISDTRTGAKIWSTLTTNSGDRLILTNTSNLQIVKAAKPIWQSFDHPTDTLVDSQNLTSPMSLHSSNNLYTLRLVSNFIGLYAKFNPNTTSSTPQIYYRHTAMQVRAAIINGQGPVTLRINPEGGYLGMYQAPGSTPADIQPFNSYQRTVPGIRRLRLEPDGNLKAYYWSGSDWVLDYQAITETCDLPSPCGPYGLCVQGKGCSCLDNTTSTTNPTQPGAGGGVCRITTTTLEEGDFCNAAAEFTVLRRAGVEVPFKEMMGYIKTASLEMCEKACESNCSCWGVVYNNATGFCYTFDYPIQTLVAVGDGRKVGYFKMRVETGSDGSSRRRRVVIAVVCLAAVLMAAVVGFGAYKIWSASNVARRKYLESEDDVVSPGPYKDLGSDSFGSIELGPNR